MVSRLENIKSWAVTSAPAVEPVSASEVKTWLKITSSADDSLISSLIIAARQAAENYCNIKLISQTIAEYWSAFPDRRGEIVLRFPLVSAISSVAYVDVDGANQTFSTYNADLSGIPPRLWPNAATEWPENKEQLKAVTITYVCGYANAAAVPDAIKTAIYLMIGRWEQNREDTVKMMPTAAENLLNPYRVQLL